MEKTLKMKLVTCRGSLKEGFEINWFNNTKKYLKDNSDFVFILEADDTFPDLFKYIQDNNNLNFLQIQEIKDGRDIL